MDALIAGAWYVLKANVNMAFLVLLIVAVVALVKSTWKAV